MNPPSGKSRTTFTDSEVKLILARAAELEAAGSGGMMTAADLRKIASEAGIDSGALERAIAESQGTAVTAPRSDLLRILTVKNLVLAVAGSALGAMALGADGGRFGELTSVAIFGPSAAFTVWRAMRHRKWGSVQALVRELTTVFASFAITIGSIGSADGLAVAVTWGVICGLGGVAIANRQKNDAAVMNPSSTA